MATGTALEPSPAPVTSAPPSNDRAFRPDVEGLRAVAVVVVVLYHVGMPGFPGGYVGVDVFYAISGYVITNLLLRQVGRYGRPHFAEFYARRARRILPAAGLVALGTVIASYALLGFIRGNEVADDARWIAVFLGNNHFASVGTNYFQSEMPPLSLLNYWSLAVEEQFYVAYPAAIAVLVVLARRLPIRTKLMVFTGATFVVSFIWSAHYTSVNSASAYFSIWTRAWELSPRWLRGGELASMGPTAISNGSGRCVERTGGDRSGRRVLFLGHPVPGVGGDRPGRRGSPHDPGWRQGQPLRPGATAWHQAFQVGREAVVLDIPVALARAHHRGQAASRPLSLGRRLALAAASVAGATITFYCLEDPVRRSKWLAKHPLVSIGMGLLIVGLVLGVATLEIHLHQTL